MFKVTVSEKGGPERELFFEEDEVSIGRLQGNSIVLPKPNVSKRHATLIFKDGKATIVDQKSTNGTYVNGRRISAAKELGRDDRIYIGDFTIRCIPGGDGDSAPAEIVDAEEMTSEDQQRPTVAMPAMPDADELSSQTPLPVDLDVEIVTEEVAGEEFSGAGDGSPVIVPEIPSELLDEAVEAVEAIEEDGDDVEPAIPKVDLSDFDDDLSGEMPELVETSDAEASVEDDVVEEVSVEEVSASEVSIETAVEPEPEEAAPESAPAAGLSQRMKKVVRPEGEGASNQHMEALRIVARHAAGGVFAKVSAGKSDFTDEEWDKLSDGVLRLVDKLRREEAIPSDVDPFAISQDLLFEFTGLGPLEELLADQGIRRILVDSFNRIVTVSAQGAKSVSDREFVNSDTMERVITKLAGIAGLPVDGHQSVLEGRLSDGTFMMVLRPPVVSEGTIMVFDRPVCASLTPDDLVQAGVMTESQRRTLGKALEKNRNIFVCGPPGAGKAVLLNAMARMIPSDDRIVIVERGKEMDLPHDDQVSLCKSLLREPEGPGSSVVTRLMPDVVVVAGLESSDMGLLIDLGLYGLKGLVLSTTASSSKDCLQRIEHMMSFTHPSMDSATIHSLAQQITDVVVVLETDDEGKSRVSEVSALDAKGKLKPIEA